MITLNVLAFLGILAATLTGGALLAFHVYGINDTHNRTIRCEPRHADIDDPQGPTK